jgi:hypothetical protein
MKQAQQQLNSEQDFSENGAKNVMSKTYVMQGENVIACTNATVNFTPCFVIFWLGEGFSKFSEQLPNGIKVNMTRCEWINDQADSQWSKHCNKFII